MKTSKKLLSLFLAMVMIITSCSVGLTAFAADANPTDSNNEYWSNGTDAEAAFDSLNDLANAYVPKLLGIDAVKKLLEENLGMKITDKTTISDVVAGASPLLLGALSGKGDKNSILGSSDVDKFSDIDFAYLEDENATMDFWNLYKFCRDNQNAGGDMGAYCKETLPKLDKLLNVYVTTRTDCEDTFNEYVEYLTETYFPYVGEYMETSEDISAEAIDNIEVDGVKLKDINDPKVAWLIDYVDNPLRAVNADMSIKTIGDFIMAILDSTEMNLAQAKGLIKKYFPDEVDKYTDDELLEAFSGNFDCILSPAYGTLLMAVILYSGLYTQQDIEAYYVTDEQLEQYVNDLNGHNMTGDQLREYYANSSPFNKYVNYYIDYFLENSIPFSTAAITGDIEKVKNVPSTKYPGKTFVEELNYIVSTRFFIDKISQDFGKRDINIGGAYAELCTVFNFVKPETDKYSYKYEDYQIPSDLIVDATNAALNNTVGSLLDPDTSTGAMVVPIIESLLDSKIVLYDKDGGVLKDLWKNLYEEPIETVVNLIPTIVIALDELVVPMVLNEGNINNGQIDLMELIGNPGGLLYKFSQAAGSEIGIGTLSFDLNKAIPAILHWLIGDADFAYDLVGHYTGDIYDNNVPTFLNIYIADNLIYGARIGTGNITRSGLARTVYRSLAQEKDANGEYHDKAGMKAEDLASAKNTAIGIDEAVTEIATFAMEAIDEYVNEHGNDPRYKKDNTAVVSQRGLNNLFVALPQVIDNLGKKFIKKYAIKSDWTYTYDGKITTAIKTFEDEEGEFEQLQNQTLEDFKATATLNSPNKVLDQFVNILIGNWINALLDIVNDLIQDDSNKITSELGLIQSLLSALGGFGETSIITDLFNGLFQLKRSDVPSFTLTKRDTGFVGFSNECGFFLLSNIQFTAKGSDEQRGIIPLIDTLINGKNTQEKKKEENTNNTTNNETTNTSTESKAPLLVNSTTDYDKLLSKENVEASQALVDTIDELLSSLLANTSLNGFDWDSTDNILSSVVTFASAFLGEQNTNDIIKILDDYLYFISGESKANPSTDGVIGTPPTADGNVDANKVYTSANLSNLVIQTYSLIENIIDYLFYNTTNGLITYKDPNKLIADALYGIVSPDAVAVRMTSYSKTAEILQDKDYLNWNSFKIEISLADTQTGTWKKDYLKYGFKDGDKTAFYDALGESLSGVAAIVGALIGSSTGYYRTILNPVLTSIANATGAEGVMTADAFEAATSSQMLIKGIITPIGNIIGKLYGAPMSFILNLVKGIAGVLDDTSIRNILNGALAPINGLLSGLVNIVNYVSPTLAGVVKKAVGNGISIKLPEKEIIVTLVNQLIGDISVSGVKLGTLFTLPIINWNKLATAKSPGEVLLLIYGYIVDAILDSTLLTSLIDGLAPGIVDIFNNLSAAQIFKLLREILAVVQSPTEVYWTFSQYASKLAGKFAYPTGITAQDANDAVGQLDDLVANVFPLLNGLGVTDIEGLGSLVNDKLYTNEILTKLATTLYGALNKNSTVVEVLGILNIDVTTKGIAAYLTDKSYGKTYSSAAATLKKAKSWNKVKSLNWGFKDGSAKAQTGFLNGLVAILRPLNNVLSIFLAEGQLDLGSIDPIELISSLDISGSTDFGETDSSKANYQYGGKLSYIVKDGVVTLKIKTNGSNAANVIKFNLLDFVKSQMENLKSSSKLGLSTNGYESAIIPLLEAFMCKNVKTYKQYKADYKKAKDNLLIDVLKPVLGLVDDVLDAPFDTVSKILPNVAYYIDSNGLTQLISNLLAPITAENGLLGALDKNGINLDKLIKELTGKSLGKIVADALGTKVKLNLELHHLEKCNIQDIVVPLVQSLLKNLKIGGKTYKINLPTFDFETIASHGTVKTVKSAAKNREGKYTRKMVQANQGEVLVAVLRYVADALIKNTSTINKALGGIKAIKKNATIKNIISSVFNTIKAAHKDDIVRAVFYLLMDEATDSYFDYRDFTYKSYDFSFGEMDENFCRTLAPMLDGLVSGLLEEKGGLLGLIGDLAYKDSTISAIACGLYSAIEGVKISDDIGSLTSLLAMTDIDFTTGNVASLLTNEAYGRTYEAAASTIKSAGSWAKVNKDSLKWGVKDRDTFLNALCAVLRPIYGVLDVLLNDASLRIFDLISIPGSDGYTSTIVPLLEAFGCYNIKTQYQYREDCFKAYDSILLDIINPIWDKVEDILNAPIEMLADILPNLSLFFANDGLLQIIDNLLTPISALLNALKPIVNVNDVLDAAGLDINALLAKAGLKLNVKLDIYDLKGTLEPLIGSENVVNLLNSILGIIKIKGASLGIVLPEIDWYKLASHGEVILNSTSQAATYGARISVKSDQDETLIAVLRFLIDTINYQGNYDAIVGLVSGLLGDGVSDSTSDMIGDVLGMLQGDSDKVIADLVDMLQSFAG